MTRDQMFDGIFEAAVDPELARRVADWAIDEWEKRPGRPQKATAAVSWMGGGQR